MSEPQTSWSELQAWCRRKWRNRFRLRRWWLVRLRTTAVDHLQREVSEEKREKAAMRLLGWLLRLMSVMFFYRCKFRRDNLGKDFEASIVFKTRTETAGCSLLFRKRTWLPFHRVVVKNECVKNPDVVLTFKNGANLFNYILFTEDHDPVNLLLENQVKMEGNLNVVYKFMYMVRYLIKPLGLT